MILNTIMNNLGTDKFYDKYGLSKTKNAMFLLHRDKAKTIERKDYNNGSWVEKRELLIGIKNKAYRINWNVKYKEDKTIQFKNGNYFVNCLYVTKPVWRLI